MYSKRLQCYCSYDTGPLLQDRYGKPFVRSDPIAIRRGLLQIYCGISRHIVTDVFLPPFTAPLYSRYQDQISAEILLVPFVVAGTCSL